MRVRAALADVPAAERAEDVEVPREYLVREADATLDRFVQRVADYGSRVTLVGADEVAVAVENACDAFGVSQLVIPTDLPPEWLPPTTVTVPDAELPVRELDRLGAALTGCALGIAETGTIILDGGRRQGRRALTLVPDVHVCVIEQSRVVEGVPAALRKLSDELRESRRPLTFISGPSATSDIELSRVEGVHGPRRFALIVVRT